MKNSKRIKRLMDHVDELESVLDYYSNGNKEYFKVIGEVRTLISELSLDQKEHDIRLIKRWEEKHGKTTR